MTPADGTYILNCLQQNFIPADVRKRVADRITSAVMVRHISLFQDPESGTKQTCLKVYNLMPAGLWKTMQCGKASKQKLLEHVTQFCLSIGLTHACERTYTKIVATVLVARLGREEVATGYQLAMQFSKELRDNIRREARRDKLPHFGVIKNYPDDAEGFLEHYPDAFGFAFPCRESDPDNCPMVCPYDEAYICHVASRMPMRGNHRYFKEFNQHARADPQNSLIYMPNGTPLHLSTQHLQLADTPQIPTAVSTSLWPSASPKRASERSFLTAQLPDLKRPPQVSPGREPESFGSQADPHEGTHADNAKKESEPGADPDLVRSRSAKEMADAILSSRGLWKDKKKRNAKTKKKRVNTPKKNAKTPENRVNTPKMKKTTANKNTAEERMITPKKTAKASAGSGGGTCNLRYPGKPTSARQPMVWRDWKIYTDMNRSCWRAKQKGVRVDQAANFRSDPESAWQRIIQIVS